MKVFYTASFYGKEKYQKYYDLVRAAIEKTGVELISPEKGNYKDVLSQQERDKLPTERLIHYEAIRKGILLADAVIIEVSNEDFQLGHEATLAIQDKKPVLCLSVNENFSEKIDSRYFFGTKYNQYSIEEVVETFIERAKRNTLSVRFNCFLSISQIHYLEKASANHNVNKSEYLRRLIDKDQKISFTPPRAKTRRPEIKPS